jgi:hypothetical protein
MGLDRPPQVAPSARQVSPDSEHTRELRELEPRILARQLRALERVAARLDDRRPVPEEAFVAELEDRIGRLEDGEERANGAGSSAWRWRLGSVAFLVLGLALLGVALLMVAGGR